jgi:hypothetical protein
MPGFLEYRNTEENPGRIFLRSICSPNAAAGIDLQIQKNTFVTKIPVRKYQSYRIFLNPDPSCLRSSCILRINSGMNASLL